MGSLRRRKIKRRSLNLSRDHGRLVRIRKKKLKMTKIRKKKFPVIKMPEKKLQVTKIRKKKFPVIKIGKWPTPLTMIRKRRPTLKILRTKPWRTRMRSGREAARSLLTINPKKRSSLRKSPAQGRGTEAAMPIRKKTTKMAMGIKPGRIINVAGLGQGTGAAIPRTPRKLKTTRTTGTPRKLKTTRTTGTPRKLKTTRTTAMSIKPVWTISAVGPNRETVAVIIIIKPIPAAKTEMAMGIIPEIRLIGDPGAVVVIMAIKGMIGGAVHGIAGVITPKIGMIGDPVAARVTVVVMPIGIGRDATGTPGTSKGIKTIKAEARTAREVGRMVPAGPTGTIKIPKNLIKTRSGAEATLNTAAQAGTMLKKTSRLVPRNPSTKSPATAISQAESLSTIPTMGATPTTRAPKKLELTTAGLTTMS
jgi:hypothetical protein